MIGLVEMATTEEVKSSGSVGVRNVKVLSAQTKLIEPSQIQMGRTGLNGDFLLKYTWGV